MSDSRTKVRCGYCGNTMERRNLKSHNKNVHKGLPISEKAPTNQPTLQLFKIPELKRNHSIDSNSENVKLPRTDSDILINDDFETETLLESYIYIFFLRLP